MPHHSRISTLMIDCLETHFEEALAFWPQALGLDAPRRPAPDQRYVTLGQIPGPLFVRLQKVRQAPGYHLDIETDGMRAETARLQAAGAHRKYKIRRWWVMEDPSGNAFCVIRPESADFPQQARRWGD